MGTASTGAARPPSSRKLPTFVVLVRGRVVYSADTLSEVGAWRDGFGSGVIFERVTIERAKR